VLSKTAIWSSINVFTVSSTNKVVFPLRIVSLFLLTYDFLQETSQATKEKKNTKDNKIIFLI
jgi:hypothetical protein